MNNEQNEIEEIAKIVAGCHDSEDNPCVRDCARCQAEYLYNAGYRKQSDTARAILQRIFNEASCGDLGEFCNEGWIFTVDDANRIAKEYGIELEKE